MLAYGDNDTGLLCTSPIYIGFDVLEVGRRNLQLDAPHAVSRKRRRRIAHGSGGG
jgi:hypothetical protein